MEQRLQQLYELDKYDEISSSSCFVTRKIYSFELPLFDTTTLTMLGLLSTVRFSLPITLTKAFSSSGKYSNINSFWSLVITTS